MFPLVSRCIIRNLDSVCAGFYSTILLFSALGVSGGPDSIALCILAANWKTNGTNAVRGQDSGFIDGLLAIVVDHGLRDESKEEANIVSRRVLDMGI